MSWYKEGSKKLDKKAFRQESWEHEFFDYQRWVIDGYSVKVGITESDRQNTIAMQIYNWNNGAMRFQQFWKYKADENKECRETYKKIVDKCKEVMDLFTKGENEEAPNVLIISYLRKGTLDIARDRIARTSIPHINYALDKNEYGEDWRSNIYGDRYPTGETTGF